MAVTLQDVYDAFFIKLPSHNFTNETSLVFQLFKAALGYASDTVSEDLSYTLSTTDDGTFDNDISQKTIELIALYMAREYLRRSVTKYEGERAKIGTKDFNKIPALKDEYDIAFSMFNSINDEITKFRQEFYPYTN